MKAKNAIKLAAMFAINLELMFNKMSNEFV